MDSYLRTLDAIATSCAHTHQLAKTRRKEADKMLKGMDQGTLTMANNANVPRNSNDAAERMNRRAEVNSLKVVEDRLNTIQKHLDALGNSCTGSNCTPLLSASLTSSANLALSSPRVHVALVR